MTKPIKLTDFFEGHRRKAYLQRYEHLLNRAGEPRFKLELRLPLLNESVLGMNGPVSEAYALMAKDGSQVGRTNLNVKMEGMTVEAFSTHDKKSSPTPMFSHAGCTLTKLAVVAEGEGEKRAVDLLLLVYMPANKITLNQLYDINHKQFAIEAVYSQSEMFSNNEPEEEDEDEDEDEDQPRKSGPQDLRAYHERVTAKKPN